MKISSKLVSSRSIPACLPPSFASDLKRLFPDHTPVSPVHPNPTSRYRSS